MQNSLGLRVHCAVLLVSVTDTIISLGHVSCLVCAIWQSIVGVGIETLSFSCKLL
jgi:hypothetical protein